MRGPALHRLIIELLYGTGLRVLKCCTRRVRDFDRRQLVVRGGKGDKDRLVMLPAAAASVTSPLDRLASASR